MSTLIDLPLDIVREIALLVDGPDTIALRQVHRSFHELPVQLTYEILGLDRIDPNIIQQYPSIHSFTGFGASSSKSSRDMDWFFKLNHTYPGYNNIRRLEINLSGKLYGPLPTGLEELYIRDREKCGNLKVHIDLSMLKRLKVLVCSSDGVRFHNIPENIHTMDVDVTNVTNWWDVPRGLRHLKIQDRGDVTEYEELIVDFTIFPLLEKIDVRGIYTDPRKFKLPDKFGEVFCLGAYETIHDFTIGRPDSSIEWDPYIHLLGLWCYSRSIDLTKFTGMRTLNISMTPGDEYKLPMNLTKLSLSHASGIPDLMGLDLLKNLSIRNMPISSIGFKNVPASITRLELNYVSVDSGPIDFGDLTNLTHLTIDQEYNFNNDDEKFSLIGDISRNHKLTDLSLVCIKVTKPIPQSLVNINMRQCELDSPIGHLNKLENLFVEESRLADTHFPLRLNILELKDNDYSNEGNGVDLSNPRFLTYLSITGVKLKSQFPASIIDLHITNHREEINVSYLHKLNSLSVDCWEEMRQNVGSNRRRTKNPNPLPHSLRHLDIESSNQCFDLTDLSNLETLNICGWNDISGMGTLPPSIKLLITNIVFDLDDHYLPNLRTHQRGSD